MRARYFPPFAHGRPRVAGLMATALLFSGCAYVDTTVKQAGYAAQQATTSAPRQSVYKHMLSRETYWVFGQIVHVPSGDEDALAVVAISDEPRPGEVVDVNHLGRADSFYGINVPEGDFRFVVVADRNGDGFYEPAEVLGGTRVSLDADVAPDNVLAEVDLDLRLPAPAGADAFRIAVRHDPPREESLFFPKGTLRTLDDPIFDPKMATLGMFQPAAFIEAAPSMFYSLEEETGYKTPVIFVHGIGGGPRDFAPIIDRLDRDRFTPWFFYYPSGADLSQSASMFYKIFLSGKAIVLEELKVAIVAHSMGGVVVREALNHVTGSDRENHVQVWITLASPIGGHPAARQASRAPVVIPSWRDLDPDSRFMARLHRKPLPDGLEYDLLFAFGDDRRIKIGENSDSVVPLSSQLAPEAQREATAQHGFDDTHVGILSNSDAIAQTLAILDTVEPLLPEDHLAVLRRGGYDLDLGPDYTPVEAYIIRRAGCYFDAVADGVLQPAFEGQKHFLAVCRGEKRPTNPGESAWIKMNRDFPDRRTTAKILPPP